MVSHCCPARKPRDYSYAPLADAMTHLKRRKRCEKEITRLDNMMDQLEEIGNRMESTASNEMFVNQIQQNIAAMKRLRQQGLSLEAVQEVMEEASEVIRQEDEVNDLISQPIAGGMDEDELNGELDDIAAELMSGTATAVPGTQAAAPAVAGGAGVAPLPALPAPSTHEPVVARPAHDPTADRELAELMAGIPGM